jgi:hypothetical protein
MAMAFAYSSPAHGASEEDLLQRLSAAAPTVADVLRTDAALKAALARDEFVAALAQITRLAESNAPDCRQAMRIIGDTVPRMKASVDDIAIDGRPDEWTHIIPAPATTRWRSETRDRAREVWKHGVAAVVRDDCLYLLAGLEDVGYFTKPYNRIDITIDCLADPAWDTVVAIEHTDGNWTGTAHFYARDGRKPPPVPVRIRRAALKTVAEFAIDVEPFAPPHIAKPIWSINVRCHTRDGKQTFQPKTRDLSIYNETARPGVAAGPYVTNLLFLAADVGLRKADRTAAAIAIMSAIIRDTSNEEVCRRLRQDNAKLLRFARETSKWQHQRKCDHRLDDYPLEAQLAWANRLNWLGLRYLSWHQRRFVPNDMENYTWSFITPETLRELRQIAEDEGLIAGTIVETAKRIDIWVTDHMSRRTMEEEKVKHAKERGDDPAKASPAGCFRGKPVTEVFARNTAAYLRVLRAVGHFYGGCPDQAWVCQDMLRAVGIAPIAFGVKSARERRVGHCWAGHYDPTDRYWRSYQPGRTRRHWWYFNVDRIAVYPYAATARRAGTQRAWDLLPHEIMGVGVRRHAQRGIPTARVREWMLLPCFAR